MRPSPTVAMPKPTLRAALGPWSSTAAGASAGGGAWSSIATAITPPNRS